MIRGRRGQETGLREDEPINSKVKGLRRPCEQHHHDLSISLCEQMRYVYLPI